MLKVVAIFAVVFLSAGVSLAAKYAKPELLVEPTDVAKSDAAKTVVLDARPRAKYDAGHIPGARWVDHAKWSKDFDEHARDVGDTARAGAARRAWSEQIARLALDANSQIVVYDDNLSKDAARVWWILRYWGLPNAKLLNGGWVGYQTAKLPTSKDEPVVKPSAFMVAPQDKLLATKEILLESLKTGSLQIVDTRSDGEFCGDDKTTNKRAGAIPGAKHLEWSDLLDKSTNRFKSADDLTKLFADAGIDLTKAAAPHCQGGGRASVMAFGMELMGAQDVRNYYRSFGEWGNADDTPVVPGKLPTK